MITKKDLDEAEARGATQLYAVFPAPEGGYKVNRQFLRTTKEALDESLKQSAKMPEWAERRFLDYDEACQYIKSKEEQGL